MSNLYDILATPPALEAYQLDAGREALARQLATSGRLRIDAGQQVNFARFSYPGYAIYKTFSRRELSDPELLPLTKQILKEQLTHRTGSPPLAAAVNLEVERLLQSIRKYREVSPEIELKVARLLVQAAHPAVISLMLLEQVEVFVGFSHTVGDMMDMESWQKVGSSSGLQSTAGRRDYCVYVSAGGDPFLEEKEEGASLYDGYAAKARLMVIAGQEIGHYADIIRDGTGRPVARHSTDIGVSRATPTVREGRLADMANVATLTAQCAQLGLKAAYEADRAVEFFAKHRPKSREHRKSQRAAYKANTALLRRAETQLPWLAHFPHTAQPGYQLTRMLADMAFNLAPDASAYRHPNPAVEEAIACAEALARVPQQVVKWGHACTQAAYPRLYAVYYEQVIPSVTRTYEELTGQPFQWVEHPPLIQPASWARRMLTRLTRA